ncbi:MAG: hypothetical protein JWO10_1101 [Microbacteriaceae bacterium]|nr:hypothetical protein [Microbacteriaceae bacterium]
MLTGEPARPLMAPPGKVTVAPLSKVMVAPRRMVAAFIIAIGLVALGASPAMALDEPKVPEPVATYFATGLVARLADLYGPGPAKGTAGTSTGITFDATTKVGVIRRVFAFTSSYLAGSKTDSPTELTNNWVASVSVGDKVAGLATVWINPGTDQAELADFDLGSTLTTALAAAPQSTVLVRDDARYAWFATDGTTLTPLVQGNSGASSPTTPAAYQRTIGKAPAPAPSAGLNQGILLAGIVLGVVVLALIGFVLLPARRRSSAVGEPEDAAPVDAMPVDAVPVVLVPAAAVPAARVPGDAAPAARLPGDAPPAVGEPAPREQMPREPADPKPPTPPNSTVAQSQAAKSASVEPATVELTAKKLTAEKLTAERLTPERPQAEQVTAARPTTGESTPSAPAKKPAAPKATAAAKKPATRKRPSN